MRRLLTGVALAALVASGCSGGGDDDGEAAGLTPTFEPESADAADASTPAATATTNVIVLGGTDAVPPSATVAPLGTAPVEVAITDPEGDSTESPGDPPPPWTDLVGARLIRSDEGFQLRVRLAGGAAPKSSDEDHTMNVASFYDVDGDGVIDYEVWANVASGGWGTSWFDNRNRRALVMEKDHVNVEVVGDEVVLRFPLGHIGDAERFRWSLASEWGRPEALGTSGTVRDEAPNDNRAASFPA